MKEILRGTLWSTLARSFRVVVKVFAVVLIARWLGPSNFGLFTLVLSAVALGAVFIDLGIAPGTARLLAEGRKNRQSIFRISFGVLLTTLGLGGVLLFSFGETLFGIINASRLHNFVGLFLGLLGAQVFFNYGRKIFEGLRRVDLSSKVGLALEWAPWTLALAAVAFIRAEAEYALIGKLIGTCLVLVGLGLVARRSLKPLSRSKSKQVGIKTLLRYSFPMMLTAASFYIYSHSDILLIQAFLGEEKVGVYGVVVRLLDTLHVPAAAIGSAAAAFFVSTKRESPDQLPNLFQKVTRGILTFYLPLVAGLLLTAERLIPFLFGGEYADAALIAVIYAPTLLMKSLSGTYSLALDYLGFAKQRAMAVTFSAVCNLGLNFLIIPYLGIVGAAVATQVTYVPLVFWYAYVLAKMTNAECGEILSKVKSILLATLAMCVGLLAVDATGAHILLIVLFGVIIYFVVAILTGVVNRKDLGLITRSMSNSSS